jgi:hypothetical protein
MPRRHPSVDEAVASEGCWRYLRLWALRPAGATCSLDILGDTGSHDACPVVNYASPEQGLVVSCKGPPNSSPVWLFDSDGPPAWPTFGLKLVDPEPREPVKGSQPVPAVKGPLRKTVAYLASLVSTMTDAHDKLYLEKADFARTITISNLGVRTTEFNLSRERAEALFNEGRRSAERFLEAWDFEGYVELFRTGKTYSRRQRVGSELHQA